MKLFRFFLSICVLIGALFSFHAGYGIDLSNGQNRFDIYWRNYKYMISSEISLPRSLAVNERYYVRSKVREIILHKVSMDIESMFVDNSRRIRDLLDTSSVFRREYPLFLDSLTIDSLIFRNNRVESSASLALRGDNGLLRRLPLPWHILEYSTLTKPEYVGEAYEDDTVKYEYRAGVVPIAYTGIVIDLRGMKINKALAPRIFSQNGRLLYGPEFILKKIGAQRGLVGYVHKMDDAEIALRAGIRPYFTVALTTRGQYKTDVVLSREDTAKAMGHPETLTNILKCRVIFIIDG
ncbi:MAG: hypothetical protein ABUK01_14810 [Leptospirales bacterium]